MSIPVFFCEPTGERLYHVGFLCGCGHRTAEHSSEAEYKDGWNRRYTTCGGCGEQVKANSAGYKVQWRRTDNGELLYDLPAGAVYEQRGYGDDDEPHNWTRAPREDGKQYIISRPKRAGWPRPRRGVPRRASLDHRVAGVELHDAGR